MNADEVRSALDDAITTGDFHDAIACGEKLVIFYSENQDTRGVAAALHTIGFLRLRVGEREGAFKALTKAAELYEQVGNDPQNMFATLATLADAFAEIGDLPSARSLYNRVAEGCANNKPLDKDDMHRWNSLWGKALFGIGQIAAIVGEIEHAREVLSTAQGLVSTLPRDETWHLDRQQTLMQIREAIGELEFRS